MVHHRRKLGKMHYLKFYTAAPGRQRQSVERQHSEESLRVTAKRHGINQKTVAKWKKRTVVKDLPTGTREPHSTVLGAVHQPRHDRS